MRRPILALAVALSLPALAAAQAPPGPMARARYSLPWNLRPAIAPNLVRVDAALAFQAAALSSAVIFTGGAKPFAAVPDLGLYGRLGVVTNTPDQGDARAADESLPGPTGTATPRNTGSRQPGASCGVQSAKATGLTKAARASPWSGVFVTTPRRP